MRRAIMDATSLSHKYAHAQEGAKGVTNEGRKIRVLIEDCYIVVHGSRPKSAKELTRWIEHLLDMDQ